LTVLGLVFVSKTLAKASIPKIILKSFKFSLSAPNLPILFLPECFEYAFTSTPTLLKRKSGSSPALPSVT
jgi:hypothetical protein